MKTKAPKFVLDRFNDVICIRMNNTMGIDLLNLLEEFEHSELDPHEIAFTLQLKNLVDMEE